MDIRKELKSVRFFTVKKFHYEIFSNGLTSDRDELLRDGDGAIFSARLILHLVDDEYNK